MLRITGGELKGRRFKTPPGQSTRPTSEKVREALFAILGPLDPELTAADLFAGSGALGMEALSRGAATCLFAERRSYVVRFIKGNLEDLGLTARARVLTMDAASASERLLAQGPRGLVLADPPYGKGYVPRVLRLAGPKGFLAQGGVLVLEHSPHERPGPEQGLSLFDQRAYGQTELSFFEKTR